MNTLEIKPSKLLSGDKLQSVDDFLDNINKIKKSCIENAIKQAEEKVQAGEWESYEVFWKQENGIFKAIAVCNELNVDQIIALFDK